jgi:tRNA nucleotidyltransferase (CCA-adding enzyme)
VRLPHATISAMRSAAEIWRDRSVWGAEAQPSRRVRLLEPHSETALAAAWIALSDEPQARSALDEFLVRLRFIQPSIDGDALRDIGLPPGPTYGRLLAALRDGWLDGEIKTEAQERQHLARLLQAEEGTTPTGRG